MHFFRILMVFFALQAGGLRASDALQMEFSYSLLGVEEINNMSCFIYRFHLASQQKLARKKFQLVWFNSAGQKTQQMKVWFDKNEKAWTNIGGEDVLLENCKMVLRGYEEGEFSDIILVDRKQLFGGIHICPKPIECKDLDGAHLWLEMRSAKGEYILQGTGFKPNEKLLAISQSEDELLPPFTIEASSEGTLISGILPWVIDKTSGRASFTVIRQDSTILKLPYLWTAFE